MGQIVDEVKQWNTPIVGAFLLWKFTKGYCAEHPHGDAPIALFHFIASAVLTSRQLLDSISNRRKNLQAYVRGFEDNKRVDLLLEIQQRVLDKRNYTMASINIAVSSGLLVWNADNGKLYPRDVNNLPGKRNVLQSTMIKDGDRAEILGKWFSAHDLSTVAAYMEVVF